MACGWPRWSAPAMPFGRATLACFAAASSCWPRSIWSRVAFVSSSFWRRCSLAARARCWAGDICAVARCDVCADCGRAFCCFVACWASMVGVCGWAGAWEFCCAFCGSFFGTFGALACSMGAACAVGWLACVVGCACWAFACAGAFACAAVAGCAVSLAGCSVFGCKCSVFGRDCAGSACVCSLSPAVSMDVACGVVLTCCCFAASRFGVLVSMASFVLALVAFFEPCAALRAASACCCACFCACVSCRACCCSSGMCSSAYCWSSSPHFSRTLSRFSCVLRNLPLASSMPWMVSASSTFARLPQ